MLNNTPVQNTVVTIASVNEEYIYYTVTGTNAYGCSGTGDIRIKVFNLLPGFLIPNAFFRDGCYKSNPQNGGAYVWIIKRER